MMRRVIDFFIAVPQIIILVLLVGAAILAFDNFLSPLNLSAIGFQHSLIGFLALGQFLVILTRGIDLSQGANVALASMVVAGVGTRYGFAAGIAGGIGIGTVIGLVNGTIVSFTRIPAFVATLGMMGVVRGIALTVTNSAPVRVANPDLIQLAWTKYFQVPLIAWVFLATALLLAAFLRGWPIGRHFYAVGGHEEHARLSGVRPVQVKLLAYGLSGAFCGLAAVFLAARLSTGHPLSGNAWELESIAAVIIGGASLFGGRGFVLGVVAGVLILGVIDSVINLAGISPHLQGGLKGVIIIVAVMATTLTGLPRGFRFLSVRPTAAERSAP